MGAAAPGRTFCSQIWMATLKRTPQEIPRSIAGIRRRTKSDSMSFLSGLCAQGQMLGKVSNTRMNRCSSSGRDPHQGVATVPVKSHADQGPGSYHDLARSG